MTKTPLHPTVEELLEKLHKAREGRGVESLRLEQVRRYRELVAESPTFAPALLELGRLLQLTDEPGVETEEAFVEIQRLLEQAVEVSGREAAPVVELGYFLDTIHNASEKATPLYEEGARKALETLEDAWAGLMRAWAHERTKESLEKAVELSELAEKLFPDSGRIQDEVARARRMATEDGLLKP